MLVGKNKKVITTNILLIACLLFFGCRWKVPILYLPNDPPKSAFSFEFPGRLENLEDAFYSVNLNYKERSFSSFLQKSPEYEFQINRHDTAITYVVTLEDCQSIYSLVKWNDNWNCNSSSIIVLKYSSNIDSLQMLTAKSFFEEDVIEKISENFKKFHNVYHWRIEKNGDTTFVKVLSQNNSLRKTYIYSIDTIDQSIAEKQILNLLGDSTIIYQNDPNQRFMYIASKQVIHKK